MTKREKKELKKAILGTLIFIPASATMFILAMIKTGIYIVG